MILAIICSGRVWAEDTEQWQSVGDMTGPSNSIGKFAGLQYGYLQGHTKYHIDFTGGASELEFPLAGNIWGAKAGFTFRKSPDDIKEAARLEFNWLTTSGGAGGTLKDSDWFDNDNHPGVDVYSESDATLQAVMMDLNYYYNLYPEEVYSFGPKVGYRLDKFTYEVRNARQVGYGPYALAGTASVDGKVLEYTVRYETIYLGVGVDFGSSADWQFTGSFNYSPWTRADDEDKHVLREKLSTGVATGSSYLTDAQFQWRLSPDWSVGLGGEYETIHTKGNQHQSFYGGPNSGITNDVDDTISAVWWQANLGIKYYF
jgi:outer membrane protease